MPHTSCSELAGFVSTRTRSRHLCGCDESAQADRGGRVHVSDPAGRGGGARRGLRRQFRTRIPPSDPPFVGHQSRRRPALPGHRRQPCDTSPRRSTAAAPTVSARADRHRPSVVRPRAGSRWSVAARNVPSTPLTRGGVLTATRNDNRSTAAVCRRSATSACSSPRDVHRATGIALVPKEENS
jgi:hypothetical protein